MGIELIAELATGHGGDLDLAKRMIDAAAGAGANMVKTQAYDLAKLNQSDPQAEWLTKAHLTHTDHEALKAHADSLNIRYFASAFDQKSADFVVKLCGLVKFASSVDVMPIASGTTYKTFPWCVPGVPMSDERYLVTVPIYPTPMECLAGVRLGEGVGWSDHCVGLAGALHAFTCGVRLFEMHLTIPGARQMAWDKTPADLALFRSICDDLETIGVGVSQTFRERWLR